MSDPRRWRHDLSNQLGIVVGFAELLLSETDPGDPKHADLQEICTAARRALELLGQAPGGEADAR